MSAFNGKPSLRIGRFTDVLQYPADRDAVGHERYKTHVGTALGTGEQRRLIAVCQQHGPEVTGGRAPNSLDGLFGMGLQDCLRHG